MSSNPNKRTVKLPAGIDNSKIHETLANSAVKLKATIQEHDKDSGTIKATMLWFFKKYPITIKYSTPSPRSLEISLIHEISLPDMERSDIRFLYAELYPQRLFVDFWDYIFTSFGYLEAPGFGDSTKVDITRPEIQERLSIYFMKTLTSLLKNEPKINDAITEVELDQDKLKQNHIKALEILANRSDWKQHLVFIIEFFLDNAKQKSLVMAINLIDINTHTFIPAEIDYFMYLPEKISREINMNYKCGWTSNSQDEVSEKIIKYMTKEIPFLQPRLMNYCSDDEVFHFKFEENVRQKGTDHVIAYDEKMKQPLSIIPLEEKGNSLVFLRQFLKIADPGQYSGFLNVLEVISLINGVFEALKSFIVNKKTPEEIQKETTIGNKVFNLCKNCGWLVSKHQKKCPMCGSDMYESAKSDTLGVESSMYAANLALFGLKEQQYSNRLISQLDKDLQACSDVDARLRDIIISNFKEVLHELEIKDSIKRTTVDDKDIQLTTKRLYFANRIAHDRDFRTLYRVLLEFEDNAARAFGFNYVYIVYDKILLPNETVSPFVVSYITYAPYVSDEFSLVKSLDKDKKSSKSKDKPNLLIWEADKGPIPKIVEELNNSTDELHNSLRDILIDIYGNDGNKSSGKFLEVDEKGKKTQYIIDLYPLVRIQPFSTDEKNPMSVIILRQFLDNEVNGLRGLVPLAESISVLKILHSTIEKYQEQLSYESKRKTGSNLNQGDLIGKISTSMWVPGMQISKQEEDAKELMEEIKIDKKIRPAEIDAEVAKINIQMNEINEKIEITKRSYEKGMISYNLYSRQMNILMTNVTYCKKRIEAYLYMKKK